jgi:very-short-patch-repair endonuclease
MKKLRHYRGGFEFAGLKALARELRKDQTSAEELLWLLLRNRQLLGFKFRRQHQFGRYVADFYCRNAQLVIECDGSAHNPNEQWHHDRNRDAYMELQGLTVLRFSNKRILKDTDSVIDEIASRLVGRSASGVGEKRK